jgi:hypothetical protein
MHRIEDCLKALADAPLIAPPAAARQATLDAMAAAAQPRNQATSADTTTAAGQESAQNPRRVLGPAGLARAALWIAIVGVTVTAGAMVLRFLPGEPAAPESAFRQPDSRAGAAGGMAASGDLGTSDQAEQSTEEFFALAVAAAELDLMLAELPRSRQVARLGTVGTILGLEDQIRLIDSEIERADAAAAPLDYRAALMRDRVDVLSALYYVRYAQSRAVVF